MVSEYQGVYSRIYFLNSTYFIFSQFKSNKLSVFFVLSINVKVNGTFTEEATLPMSSFLMGVISYRKEFAPFGANSFP